MKGTVFDIKGFALNDGPGIRTTVFMKGCPLRCIWCHNPEGLSPEPELFVKTAKCTGCGRCRNGCNHDDCKPYGRCLHVCPNDCLKVCGKTYEPDELVRLISRDTDIFGKEGGVTFSGGEPLFQHEFVSTCAGLLRQKGISTVLETSSFAVSDVYRKCAGHFDLIYADIKLFDRNEHIKYCGVPNDIILENVMWLIGSGLKTVIRIPLIPGITDTDYNLTAISEFAGNTPVELLSYNPMAGAKYSSVGRAFSAGNLQKQSPEALDHMKSMFANAVIRK